MTGERPKSVLLVEDDASWAALVREMLIASADVPDVKHVQTLGECLSTLAETPVDVTLLDLHLPDSNGLETVAEVRQHFPEIPVVVLTGSNGEYSGVDALRLGAQDYISKDEFRGALLDRVIRYAVERSRLQHELEVARHEREVSTMEQLPGPVATVTGRLYASLPLREAAPEKFQEFTTNYCALFNHAIEERIYKKPPSVSAAMEEMAHQIGMLRGSPRDVIEIHLQGLKLAQADCSDKKKQALIEEGRILLLSLMGFLAGFYRSYYPMQFGRGSS